MTAPQPVLPQPGTEMARLPEDPATIAARLMRLGLGGAILAGATVGRAVVARDPGLAGPGEPIPAETIVNVLVGAVDVAVERAVRLVDALYRAANPVARPASRIGGVVMGELGRPIASALRLRPRLDALADRGAARRHEAETETVALLESTLPATMAAVLTRVDLTEHAVTALDRVDLERIVTATAEQMDLTDVALAHIDMQRVIAASLDQVDMVALVREQLEQVDVTELIRTAPGTVAGEALRQTQAGAGKAMSAIVGRITPRT